jgi:hypothetical protein
MSARKKCFMSLFIFLGMLVASLIFANEACIKRVEETWKRCTTRAQAHHDHMISVVIPNMPVPFQSRAIAAADRRLGEVLDFCDDVLDGGLERCARV